MGAKERLGLAFEQITYEHGFAFERFATAFLATEFPDLRPVGGMHDAGRDAFLHRSEGLPDTFVQCSVTADWAKKIRDTIGTLHDNGFPVRELIYCYPQRIQADADELRGQLRRGGVSLDVRDRNYFTSRAESSVQQRAAAEELTKQLVDPLLTSREVLANATLALTTEEERVAATYLQLELRDRDPAKGLSKLCFEALVTFALREASPDDLLPRTQLIEAVRTHVPAGDRDHLDALTCAAIDRLVKRDRIKHHTKEDAFTLSRAYREDIKARVEQLLVWNSALSEAARTALRDVAAELGIDYDYPAPLVALDAIRVLDRIICDAGRLAAVALVGKDAFAAPRQGADQVLREIIKKSPQVLVSLGRGKLTETQVLDLVPVVVERLSASPAPEVTHRLRLLADAYCLQFLLQQTPDVQQAIGKIVSGTTLLLDTSIAITAMSEKARTPEVQRISNLLRAAVAMGCRLIVGADVLNELETHLHRILNNYRMHQSPSSRGKATRRFSTPLLEEAYENAIAAGLFVGSFADFIEQFMGPNNPEADLIDYLRSELGVEFVDLTTDIASIPAEELGSLFEEWKQRKNRRPWVDEQSHETLVMHDARAFLLVERKRGLSLADKAYAHRWWWLAIDGAAVHFDRQRHGRAVGSCVCMSPEFFARYLSLAPKSKVIAAASSMLPALAREVASLGLIPSTIRQEAEVVYRSFQDQPEYLRRRKLRDLVNGTMATARVAQDFLPDDDDRIPLVSIRSQVGGDDAGCVPLTVEI